MDDENRITYFAETDARNKRVKFGIKAKDRTRHVYVIGKTGMGKSTMLENMAVQDITNGEGMCFIDPHGKTADLLLEYVPKERIRDVIHIAPFDTEFPISFNVLESVDPEKRHLVVSGLMSTFKKIWEDAWSARMEYILTNTLLALLEAPGSTLLGVNRMLSDKEYRKEIVSHVQDPSVKAFWVKEFANYTERMAAEAVPAIQNKVGQFTANPLIRNMIGQAKSSFDFREAMDRRKIIVINLSKGRIGDENMKLLGGLLVTKIYLAAMSRADVPDRTAKLLPNFYLFVDEFQNFANASFADILSEARKYKLNLTIAHQYIEQMDDIVRPAVFGNVGTMIAFRVGATDAEELEKEFSPVFLLEDLVNLGFAQIYLKLMIDGLSSQPFSATTLPPIPHPDSSYVKEIIDASREQFARPKAEVEEKIVAFHNPVVAPKGGAVKATSSTGASTSKVGGVATASHSANAEVTAKAVKITETLLASKLSPDKVLSSSPKKEEITASAPAIDLPKPISSDHLLKKISQIEVNKKIENNKKPENNQNYYNFNSPKSTPPTSTSQVQNVQVSATTSANTSFASISLKALSSKDKLKTDPKVPTQQNVNDLKSALSAVLAKAKENNKSGGQAPAQSPIQNPSQSTKKIPDIQAEVDKIVPQVSKMNPGASTNQQPREVPEDLLKKVLK
jgi:tRNA isopentenyl-2-thiomethyl-A-37 hydroxylase MiaE